MFSNYIIYIDGHYGMVGSAIKRNLESKVNTYLIYCSHQNLNLSNQQVINGFCKAKKPTDVFLAAAKVGGIFANSRYPANSCMKT